MTRQMKLGLFLLGTGSHIAGWRYPGALTSFIDLDALQKIAATAERGKMDLIFVGDNLVGDPTAHPSFTLRFEPITLLAALATTTKRIGLGATASTTYGDPFTLARAFSSLDHLSNGRAAWNAVTTANGAAAANFGTVHPDHSARYENASEFLDVVRGLWDCWEDDAVVADPASGLYIDPGKVRSLDHDGRFYKVRGPLNISRSPQGQPIILQAGGSPPGQELAARTADVVFSVVQDFTESKTAYQALKARLPKFQRDADDLTILPGVMPVIGKTDREARDKLNTLQSFVTSDNAIEMMSERLGHDMSKYDMDGPIPELPPSQTYESFARVMLAKARRENMTLRDLYNLTGAARGHWVLCGTPEYIADTMQEWFENRAADGFNVMPPYLPGGLDDFVNLVIPILQERGLFRAEYNGFTLRDHLGISRPANIRH